MAQNNSNKTDDADLENSDTAQKDKEEGPELSDVPPKKGKRMILILAPLLMCVIGAAGYAAWRYYNGIKPANASTPSKDDFALKKDYAYLELNDLIVTLSSSVSKKSFLKVSLSIQVKNKQTADIINTKMPLVKDSFQVFLRELRAADLSGSAGILMLKIELIKRVNKIAAPDEVLDILFKEILLS